MSDISKLAEEVLNAPRVLRSEPWKKNNLYANAAPLLARAYLDLEAAHKFCPRMDELEYAQAENKRLTEANRVLREALEAVEWVYDEPSDRTVCAWCGGRKGYQGHSPDCLRQRALAQAKGLVEHESERSESDVSTDV